MTSAAPVIADLMGGEAVLGRVVLSAGDLRDLVEHGLPKSALTHVVRAASSDRRVQQEILRRVVPAATWKRRRDRLNLVESERTERIARVTALARDVWGDRAEAFLTNPHPMLDGKTPLQAATTDLGARAVEDILYALKYGLPV